MPPTPRPALGQRREGTVRPPRFRRPRPRIGRLEPPDACDGEVRDGDHRDRTAPRRRPGAVRPVVRHLAVPRRPDDVDRRTPRALPPGPPPARRPRGHGELRLPAGRLGTAAAHRRLRRHPHLRHHRGRRARRPPRPHDPPQTVRHRSGHRRTLPRGRPRAAAVDPLRADRQLPARPAPLRRPPHPRPGRPLRRREPGERPPRRARPGHGPRRHRRARRVLRGDPPRTRRRPRCPRRGRLPARPARPCPSRTWPKPAVAGDRRPGVRFPPGLGAPAVRAARTGPAQRHPTPAPHRARTAQHSRRSTLAAASRSHLESDASHGPGSRPSPYTLRTSAAILDRPGRA